MDNEIKAAAEVVGKTPESYPFFTYLWVIGISIAGGIVSFIRQLRNGTRKPHNLMELVGEVFTSAFVGVVTFWFCEASNISPLWTAVMVAVSGHMGTRAIYIGEKLIIKRFGS